MEAVLSAEASERVVVDGLVLLQFVEQPREAPQDDPRFRAAAVDQPLDARRMPLARAFQRGLATLVEAVGDRAQTLAGALPLDDVLDQAARWLRRPGTDTLAAQATLG